MICGDGSPTIRTVINMKRFFSRTLTVLLLTVIILSAMSCTAACAESADMGDTVVVRVTVGGEPHMISLSATVAYDKEDFDLLSYDAPLGSSSCNDTVDGEFSWATIYDIESGLDFTAETDVLVLTLIAKRDISDIDGMFVCTVKEAYNVDFKEVDMSKVSIYAAVYGDNEQDFDLTSSKTQFVISKYERGEDSVADTDSRSEASESEIISSGLSSSELGENSNINENTSNSEHSQKDSEDIESSGTIVSKTQNGIVISYDESEYREQPPIRFDTIDQADKSDRKISAYMVGIVIGCIVIAAIAAVLIIFKDRLDGGNGQHYK